MEVLIAIAVYFVGAVLTNFLLHYIFVKQNLEYDAELDYGQRENKFMGAIFWPITLFLIFPGIYFARFWFWFIHSMEDRIENRVRRKAEEKKRCTEE